MKRITIKDLAEMLNISTSTVSRALKDHPDISSTVKQRVKEAAETFNYVPNDFAINFRKKIF
ncbi:LacI family DNA-binding transcriptional regulator [Chryseobacterium sp. SORGH_AS_1048]|uniref:LacI family DNA-binding transcriptional regulator n=1 Tax=Chryseobacterium sp. SORGH_AS_1048 TaxID=3041783 RepID=UPI002787CE50|nr:LacI family DNA-binding transcriptional regulator [Chryseobacterium sp. SORGH_AS_1048]MDQ1098914.1 DNA-binding LacI/PurR family transcriptional regulator [Chryseobacterium sp. SORGH_AS_1048]